MWFSCFYIYFIFVALIGSVDLVTKSDGILLYAAKPVP